MKRAVVIFGIVLVFLGVVTGCTNGIKNIGTEKYYTKIVEEGTLGEGKRYMNKVTAYNEKGEEKQIEFTSEKILTKDALLRLNYSDKKGVKTWEEVKEKDVPAKAKEKLGLK